MITIDGYFEGPGNDISWHNVDAKFNEYAIDQLNSASALIFGRKTYELMASYWPTDAALQDDAVVARMMNSLPKVVFSKTLKEVTWSNTRLYNNELKKVCNELKSGNKKDIFVFGSADLASDMIKLNLIDEFRFIISPIVLGDGRRIFGPDSGVLKMKLERTKVFQSGNVLMVYGP